MNHTQKRRATPFLATMLAFAMLFALLPATVFAIVPPHGTTGIWVWEQLPDGTVSITGCTTPTGALSIPAILNANGSDRAVTEIVEYAFYQKTGITAMTLPEGLVTIGQDAFREASGLVTINFPDSLRTVGAEAFEYCSSIESIVLNEGLETLEGYCFADMTKLKEIVIPASVTAISYNAFSNDTALESVIVSYGVTGIGEAMFYGCTNLTDVYLPYGLETIGMGAFQDCTSLVSIDIPSTVEAIGSSAFSGCTALASVVLPQKLMTLNDEAFKGCSVLEAVTIFSDSVVFGVDCFKGVTPLSYEEAGLIFGVDASTAETYATDNLLRFSALLVDREPRLVIPDSWTALYGKTFTSGTVVDLSGGIYGNFGLGDYRVYARVDGGIETLIATVTEIPDAAPFGEAVPVTYTANFTIPAGLSNGPHWLTVFVRDMNNLNGIPQHILFQVTGNPETGDSGATPWMLLVMAVAAAVVLGGVRRKA